MRFTTEAIVLKAFCRSMGDVELDAVGSSQVLKFISGNRPITSFWFKKFEVLNGFYRFCIARRLATSSPLPTSKPQMPVPCPPYIYSQEEIWALLAGTSTYGSSKSKLSPDTFRCLLLTLFATGLRLGEALRLRLEDVDLEENILHVHESKFFKSRLVPIGHQLSNELAGYTQRRKQRPCPDRLQSAFFAARDGMPLDKLNVERRFRKLREHVGIRRAGGARSQPRMHDLRHTFGVTRLVSWYREKADVQELLPKLSTYLGHVDISATQRYLTLTSDLLVEACSRFERYASGGDSND
jgi:site-specific recombinase XerD